VSGIILQATARVVEPVLVFVSVYFLLSGHDAPGGGFVGGLTAASAFALHAIAFGIGPARRALRVDPRSLIGAGLLLASLVAIVPLALGSPPLDPAWAELRVPTVPDLHVGTPLLFDLGVYLAVIGASLAVILALGEEAP
jgi:multicomponent Na+:H+ antiporter subunit B